MAELQVINRAADAAADSSSSGTAASGRIWLSILVPVYNVAPYLAACLDSIIAQLDGGEIEILLLDDGSTDGSRAIAETAEALCPAVRLLVHPENRGLSAARNTMLGEARGDYVWFVDSDDMLQPGALRALRAIIVEHGPDLVLCDYGRTGRPHMDTFAGPSHRLETDRQALIAGVFTRRRLHVWSKICRRTLWGEDIRFPVGRCFEDISTIPWILLRARSYYYAAEPWVFYRDRAGSIMARIRTRDVFDADLHDDLAGALRGYREDFAVALPDARDETRYRIGCFCAKQFTKLVRRRLRARAWSGSAVPVGALDDLARYRRMLESTSPLPFDAVARRQLRSLKLVDWVQLRVLLAITGRRRPDR